MDQSFSDSDITMSPSQILERLQMLRQLQILQRSKLKKQMNFTDSPEIASITEIVSHFSNSTSYNTFRSLLQSPEANVSKQSNVSKISPRENLEDVIDGVTLLNLSQESEFINDSPSSAQSSIPKNIAEPKHNENDIRDMIPTNQISLEEMPILSPKKDFETLILEKLRKEETSITSKETDKCIEFKSSVVNTNNTKRPFLKRGEGMARFGVSKQNLIIQNTNTLPWKKKDSKGKPNKQTKTTQSKKTNKNDLKVQIIVNDADDNKDQASATINKGITESNLNQPKSNTNFKDQTYKPTHLSPSLMKDTHKEIEQKQYKSSNKKHLVHKEKTWASVLSKEQNDLLSQLKQSDYYKNFISPTKSIVSDISCDDNVSKLRQEKELAEQNLFELLEKKVNHESFNFENSFFNRFLGRTALESSGESTPLVLKKCISNNPRLMNIAPSVLSEHQDSNCNSETCECEDTCSSVSCCCSCKTITDNNVKTQDDKKDFIDKTIKTVTKNDKIKTQNESHNDTIVNKEASVDMAEMNAKLIATSELLKQRLIELEDEIEIFRQENMNLSKMREEVETERQKFFEEKQEYEKKFNEEKILSEYYLAEEKDKLQKQKQIYDRYVRDIRGRINKKERDEVSILKKEIQELKEEIRIKDAKSTSALARLRNQIKIMEKEKKNYVEEIENLKKENRRMKHSNDISRRLTNIKYLEQINQKLTNMGTKNAQSNITLDPDMKYKAHFIERQSRARTVQPITKNTMRPRAKSVPNLKVTSRYAKYFSQKDTLSDMDKYKVINDCNYPLSDDESDSDIIQEFGLSKERKYSKNLSASDEDNNLEKIYNERFKANAVSKICKQKMSSSLDIADELANEQVSNYFLSSNTDTHNEHMRSVSKSSVNVSMNQKKSPSIGMNSKSPTYFANYSTSSGISTNMSGNISHTNDTKNYTEFRHDKDLNKSPTFSNHSSISHKSATEASKFNNRMTPSPEPTTSKMNVTKTNLNPTEILKSDGSKELRFPNGNIKTVSSDGKYSKFVYYNGDIKENFYNEGRIKYFYSETKTIHTTHADGLEVLEFPDGQIEKRYKDGSSEIRLPNGSIRYFDPKNEYVREEWRFPDGAALTVSANGEQRIVFPNGQVEVHTKEHKRREFPDGTVKLIYNDGTSETRYSSGRVRIKDKQGNLIMDSAPS